MGLGQLSRYGACILLPDWVWLYLQGDQGVCCMKAAVSQEKRLQGLSYLVSSLGAVGFRTARTAWRGLFGRAPF